MVPCICWEGRWGWNILICRISSLLAQGGGECATGPFPHSVLCQGTLGWSATGSQLPLETRPFIMHDLTL